ncbi:MAG TPA: TadE/TadG family type IV pilus assembly protein [Jatrophihabitantaceae bacterium]|nr:TadE/TadG family type IV pilus assembly protein [Jatrophihabitantaceae bacterium]
MRARLREDTGAAVIEFVMMSALLVMLLLAVLQVAIYFYARNVTAASAADAARYAAAEGIDPGAGAARAEELIRRSTGLVTVHCTSRTGRDAVTGLLTSTVHCRGRVRVLFLPLELPLTIDVHASVLKERAP